MRWLTAGESHGPALVGIIEGLPAHIEISSVEINHDLARRRLGYGRGARQNFEADKIRILGGIRHGFSQGGPIAIEVGNTEWPKWEQVMASDPVDPSVLAELARNAPLTRPRPGHADLVGMQKYSFEEARPILERASARETATRVALGAVARAFLNQSVGCQIFSHVVSIGPISINSEMDLPGIGDVERIDSNPVRCADEEAATRMVEEIEKCHTAGDTLGGVVEVIALGVPVGLGSHVHWDRRIDSRLAGALMGIQAIKGVELGDGFETSRRRGSVAHDEIERDAQGGIRRRTGRSGGTEGGMTTGEILRVRAAMKP
ncbi:MAG: chorismate synthase, partial [Actinobacteria bacterium]|nr:chorismate synthase [Actinomycetota bacterium]